jgi:hypothetical protein
LAYAYLSEEPERLEWPEDGDAIEHERVRVRSKVAVEETHFNLIII